jgi:hypothetical protein
MKTDGETEKVCISSSGSVIGTCVGRHFKDHS